MIKTSLTIHFVFACAAAASVFAHNIDEAWRWKQSSIDKAPNLGDAIKVGWSVPADGTEIPCPWTDNATNNLNATLKESLGGDYMEELRFMFDRVGSVSGLEFVEMPDDNSPACSSKPGIEGQRGDIRIVGRELPSGASGWSDMPNDGKSVIIQMNTATGAEKWDRTDWINVMMHEIGHASGLHHTEIFESAEADTANLSRSIVGLCNPSGPQFDDVYALHRLYGDRMGRDGGNDTKANASNLGNLSDTSISLGTDANSLSLGKNAVDFLSIDGDTDVDYYYFTLDSESELFLKLEPTGPTYDYKPEGGERVSLVSKKQSRLAFKLYDSDGNLLETKDEKGLGEPEMLDKVVCDGKYFIKVFGDQDSNQFYQIHIEVSRVDPNLNSSEN